MLDKTFSICLDIRDLKYRLRKIVIMLIYAGNVSDTALLGMCYIGKSERRTVYRSLELPRGKLTCKFRCLGKVRIERN